MPRLSGQTALGHRCRRALQAGFLAALLAGAATADEIPIGVHVNNPQWLEQGARDRILDQLAAARVRLIRVPLVPAASSSYDPTLAFVASAFSRGISTLLVVPPQFPPGTKKRPRVPSDPDSWDVEPLSAQSPEQLAEVLRPVMNAFEARKVRLAAIELGNEINWSPFNGDFPIPSPTSLFTREDLDGTPAGQRLAAGLRAYVRSAAVLKTMRSTWTINGDVPIVAAGLADPAPSAGPSRFGGVAINTTLRLLRDAGLDAEVDFYGVHVYASEADAWPLVARHLADDVFKTCEPAGAATGKPCWLTEWAVVPRDKSCGADEAATAALTRRMLNSFSALTAAGRLGTVIYFDWSDPATPAALTRCGRLTAIGELITGTRLPAPQ